MSVIIRPARHGDAWRIVPFIQEADRREMEATGLPIGNLLAFEIAASAEPKLAEAEGEPVAMWGLTSAAMLTGEAWPWLVTCRAILRHRVRMAREGLAQLAAWRAAGWSLNGFVDDRYGAASAWMARAGFEVAAATVPFGPEGVPFHEFRRAA